MAALPVIADVYRVVLLWTSAGGPTPVNVFHVRCTDTGDVSAIVGKIGSAHAGLTTGEPFEGMSNNFTVTGCDITPLDGTTASTTQDLGTEITGSGTGDIIPNMAAVESFQTTVRGPRGRGRMYIGPIGEATQSDGTLSGGVASGMTTGWANLIAAMAAGSPSVQLVVASYVHGDANDVVSNRTDALVGSMRRRLDALR